MRYFLFFLPLVFCACEGIKHQQEVDRKLEDVGVAAAEASVKALDEDNADRDEARRERQAGISDAKANQK